MTKKMNFAILNTCEQRKRTASRQNKQNNKNVARANSLTCEQRIINSNTTCASH